MSKIDGINHRNLKGSSTKMKIHKRIVQNTWLEHVAHGWGNGYIGVRPGHPWFEKECDDIGAEVHGDLTFGGRFEDLEDSCVYWIGFDTCHYGDNETNWTREDVKEEVERLYEQATIVAKDAEQGTLTVVRVLKVIVDWFKWMLKWMLK